MAWASNKCLNSLTFFETFSISDAIMLHAEMYRNKYACGHLMSETYGWKLTLILAIVFSKRQNQSILQVYLT